MSEEQLKAFLETVEADPALQEQLKSAGDADALVAIAKAAGFTIDAAELLNARHELSDGELEDVAGGNQCWWATLPYDWWDDIGRV